MALKRRTKRRHDDDEARFEAWLNDFDSRHADPAARLDALLHTLGVDPTVTLPD